MSEFLGSVWWLIVSLGVLVTFHEFGHYWVARRCGVKVLRFSIGFGRPLWSRRGRDGTVYQVAILPLGGYVKMLDERESPVPAEQAAQAFNRASVWKRIAIVVAGPLANLLLCVLLLWAMFVIGRPDYAPVVGQSTGIAEASGLRPGDRVDQVGDRATPTWSEVHQALLPAALDHRDIALHVTDASNRQVVRDLRLSQLPDDFDQRRFTQAIGLLPRHALVPPLVGRVEPDSAAWGILAAGDRVTAIDGASDSGSMPARSRTSARWSSSWASAAARR